MSRNIMKFGVRIPNSSFAATPMNIAAVAREAEIAGFHTLYLNDHINVTFEKHREHRMGRGIPEDPGSTSDPNFFESLSTIAYLAGMTSRVELALGVLLLPIRDPLTTAKQIATIDALSSGRVIVGIGVGNSTDRHELGLMRVPLSERRGRAREYLLAMYEIWKEPIASFHGEFVNFEGATIYPKPARIPHPPVLMGGNSGAAMEMAAELCDGWIPPFMSPGEYGAKVSQMRQAMERHGRSTDGFHFAFQAFASVDADGERARRRFLLSLGEGSKHFSLGLTKEGSPARLLEKGVVGTPTRVASRIEEFASAGATRFDAFFTYPNLESFLDQIRLFGKEVIPSF